MSHTTEPRSSGGSGDEPDIGGDPACWLARLCPECGLFSPDEPPTCCSACGAEIED